MSSFNINIVEFKEKYIEDIKDLYNKYLYCDYDCTESFPSIKSINKRCVIVIHDNKCIGFLNYKLLDEFNIKECFAKISNFIDIIGEYDRYCILKSIIVNPEHRGLGIAKKLTQKALEEDVDCFITLAWLNPNGDKSNLHVLERLGFRKEAILEKY